MELNVSTPFFGAFSHSPSLSFVKNPYISPRHFYSIMARYDSFAHTMNGLVRELRRDGQRVQTLKSGHRAMFQDIVNQIKGQMDRHRRLFADTPQFLQYSPFKPYVLTTNRAEIRRRTGKDGSTAWRNLQRLHEAGIIVLKVNHGTRANFELHINPAFLLISDYAAETDAPVDFLQLTSEKHDTPAPLRAKCTPFKKSKNSFNNEIMDVDTEQLNGIAHPGDGVTSLPRTHKNTNRNTGECGAGSCEMQGHSPKSSFANDEKEQVPGGAENSPEQQIAKARRLYATWLVQYMLQILFPNHTHYKAAIHSATDYAEHYFTGCRSSKEFSNRQVMLMWRVDAVAKWATRTKFSFANIFLPTYLDLNNKTCGFVNTEKWWKAYVEKKAKDEKKRKFKSDSRKLSDKINALDAVYLVGNLPQTVKEFLLAEQYVQKNIPHRLSDFYERTKYIRYDWYSQAKTA